MTLTTEQLRARAESLGLDFFIERRAGIWVKEWFNNGCTSATAEEVMMWSMLANREAQPVGYIDPDSLKEYRGQRAGGTWSAVQRTTSGLNMTTPIYTAPPAPAVPDDYQHLKNVRELYHKQEDRLFSLAQRIKGASFDKYRHVPSQAIDVLEREIFGDDGDAYRAAMLAAAPEGA
ncbi:hypothetical protein [Serratia sp. OPWLW2]|uniref:hypothetical protein n=1 Tax=Serratia sp. OPWLW2 TaxID=1928658 RepID=UPI000C19144F|nr:hypothetical protein [Serratia sp. OPWLW2]PIJ41212.1 hypothetical protein BOM25_16680 [Serratia sp. OPWLW2]